MSPSRRRRPKYSKLLLKEVSEQISANILLLSQKGSSGVTSTFTLEIPAGSSWKIQNNPQEGTYVMDRRLSHPIPVAYGFLKPLDRNHESIKLPEDGDLPDAFLLLPPGQKYQHVGVSLTVSLIAKIDFMDMASGGGLESDPKFLAIPSSFEDSATRREFLSKYSKQSIFSDLSDIVTWLQKYKLRKAVERGLEPPRIEGVDLTTVNPE